jgi:GNAT superfamily N-acetyltransferase
MRSAQAADVEAIVEIFRSARAEATPWLPVLHTVEEDRVFFGGSIDEADVRVVEVDGRVVAFAIFEPGLLRHMYVRPEAQRRGIGSVLLDEAQRALPKGFTLWTHQANDRARRFYEKHGLRAIAFTDGENEERMPDVQYEWRP